MRGRKHGWHFLAAILLIEGVGAGIGIVTAGQISGWYETLTEPPGTPPNWVFGPVWTVLYAMIAISGVMFWIRSAGEPVRKTGTWWFFVQLLLNFAWTPAFFGAQQLGVALAIILALNVTIWLTIRAFSQVSRVAAWLLVPYAIWVGYATYLNTGFFWLTR